MRSIKRIHSFASRGSKSSLNLREDVATAEAPALAFPIHVAPSPSTSFVVCSEALAPGQLVLSEAPLMTLDRAPSDRSVQAAFTALPQALQLAFLSLPSPLDISLSQSSTLTTTSTSSNKEKGSSLADLFLGERRKVTLADDSLLSIWNANAFPLGPNSYPCDLVQNSTAWTPGVGIFPLLARFAHACSPSTTFHWSASTHRMLVHAISTTPSSSVLTITLVDPFAPASSRREALRRRFGFRCRCATCSLPEDQLRLSDARRERVHELWREMPFHKNAVDAVRAVDEALELLDEEGLGGFKGCFCYDAFQYCVACSDFSAAKVWIRRAHDAYVKERGEDSEDAKLMARYRTDPSSHHATGRLPQQSLRNA